MPNRVNDLEQKIEKLLRYVELLEQSLKDVKEQIETRTDLDKMEKILYSFSKPFKCRNIK